MIDAHGWNHDMSEAPRDGQIVDLWAEGGFRLTDCRTDFVRDRLVWTDTMHHGSVEAAGPFIAWRYPPKPPVTPATPT